MDAGLITATFSILPIALARQVEEQVRGIGAGPCGRRRPANVRSRRWVGELAHLAWPLTRARNGRSVDFRGAGARGGAAGHQGNRAGAGGYENRLGGRIHNDPAHQSAVPANWSRVGANARQVSGHEPSDPGYGRDDRASTGTTSRRAVALTDRHRNSMQDAATASADLAQSDKQGHDLRCRPRPDQGGDGRTWYTRTNYEIPLAAGRRLSRLNPSMTFVYISGAGTGSQAAIWARVKQRTKMICWRCRSEPPTCSAAA